VEAQGAELVVGGMGEHCVFPFSGR
jgi:hypothetical protein